MKNIYKNKNEDFDIYKWYNSKSKKFRNTWKLKDIEWIYDNYLLIDYKDLLYRFPNINYKTLTNLIYQWDIRKIEKNIWSDNDIKFLIKNYSTMFPEDLQKEFKNRSWGSIIIKANRLGLTKDSETLSLILKKGLKKINNKGSNCNLWRGGITPLYIAFRNMLNDWKFDSLRFYDFKCAILGIHTDNLQVHHKNENFSDLIVKTFEILKYPIHENMELYDSDQREKLSKTFLQLNYDSGLGVVLDKSIHKLFHILYSKRNNTPEQFEEFKQRYINGEFEDAQTASSF